MTVQLPQFLNLDGVYGASALGLPFRFLVTEGIGGSGDYAVTQNGTPNMSVNVAAGVAFVLGDDLPDAQPNYLVRNDATVNVALTPADVTNPRIDLIVLEVRDSVFSGTFDDGRLRAIAGTPAGSPVAPALPNNCMPLAEVLVSANETTILNADITDKRPIATPGGELLTATGRLVIVCTTATRPGSPADGQVIWDTTINELLIWSSTAAAWVRPEPNIPAGSMYVIQCTSGTRPGSPIDGQPIYETDTDQFALFSSLSNAWVYPSALLGSAKRTTDVVHAGGSGVVTGCSITITTVANRNYEISGVVNIVAGATGERYEMRLRRAATTILGLERRHVGADRYPYAGSIVDEPGAGSTTYDLFIARLSGAGSVTASCAVDRPAHISIRDAGPA